MAHNRPRFFVSASPERQAVELMRRAINGEQTTMEEALAMYGNPANWSKIDGKDANGDPRNYWAWTGPVIVGYEMAQLALEAHLPPSFPRAAEH